MINLRSLFPWLLGSISLFLVACSSAPKAPEPKAYPAVSSDAVRMERLWKLSAGNIGDETRLLPAVGEQRIFVASKKGVVTAVDRENGRILWKKNTALTLTAGPAAGYGMIVLSTVKGEVVALAENDGHLLWKVAVGAVINSRAAITANTIIVLASDGVIHALAREDGTSRWTYNTSTPALSLRGNATPLIDGSRVYIATSGGKMMGMDSESGVSGWDVRVATNAGRSELERMNDIVGDLLQSADGTIYSIGYQSQLTASDPDSGRRRWQLDASSVNGLAEGLGSVYFTDVSGNVYAVDQASGKVSWKQIDYQWRVLTSPVVVAGVLAFGDNKGRIHLLAQSDGQVRGRVKISGDALLALIARDDVLYGWDKDGHLSAWKIRS